MSQNFIGKQFRTSPSQEAISPFKQQCPNFCKCPTNLHDLHPRGQLCVDLIGRWTLSHLTAHNLSLY